MAVATLNEVYTSIEAARELGVTDAYVRQLCIDNEKIGRKHGKMWLLTDADIERIRALPTFGTGPRFRKSEI